MLLYADMAEIPTKCEYGRVELTTENTTKRGCKSCRTRNKKIKQNREAKKEPREHATQCKRCKLYKDTEECTKMFKISFL